MSSIANLAAVLALAPFLLGVINRTKAVVAGRSGPPLLQAYFDLAKLLRKGFVVSDTTTWVFLAGPVVSVVARRVTRCVGSASRLIRARPRTWRQ